MSKDSLRSSVGNANKDWFLPRSILFTTAHLPSMIQKATLSNADAVCLDLEDGVPIDRKGNARDCLEAGMSTIESAGKTGLIRINSELEHVAYDLAHIPPACAAVVLPKTQGIQHIEALADSLDRLFGHPSVNSDQGLFDGPGIIAMVESAAGIQSLAQNTSVRGHQRLIALSIGTEDLAADMCCDPGSGLILHAFDQLSMCSTRLGVTLLGFPDSIAEFRDLERFEVGVKRGKRSGSSGAFCIHPAQVDVLNSVFRPDQQSIDWAKEVIGAFEDTGQQGVISIKGKMIDLPVYKRAKRIVARGKS